MRYVFKINKNLRFFTVEDGFLTVSDLGKDIKYYPIHKLENKIKKLNDEDLLLGVKVKSLKKIIYGSEKNEKDN